jgi:iduronate 2-sulfatase
MKRFHYLLFSAILFGLSTSGCAEAKKSENDKSEKMNVLFIAVDDLRNQAGIYGDSQMKTPSIDRLGEDARVFDNAYCQVPVCGASRASLLSGLYPTATRFRNYYARKDKDAPEVASLPMHFKNNGYTTLSRGKIYHHVDDDIEAWSEKPYIPDDGGIGWQAYITDESKEIIKENRDPSNPNEVVGPPFEAADVPDNGYPDGMLTDKVFEDLEKFSKSEEPFFLAVGFWKPHLPFNAPKKYWDLYDENDINLADNPFPPQNAPDQAMHNWNELRGMYAGVPQEGPVSDELARKLIHGYYACVSYTDAQIGKILGELDRLGLAENTVVVLWGDHGWHLGEHGLWCKHCNFDKVIKAPLIVKAPGTETSDNKHSNSLIEFTDIYPTLCDLANLDKPKHLDGKSFVKVLKDPDVAIHEAAYSRYHDGETIVTRRYAYTEWTGNGEMKANMLYDHQKDPDENVNVVDDLDYKDVAREMKQLLNQKRKTIAKKNDK